MVCLRGPWVPSAGRPSCKVPQNNPQPPQPPPLLMDEGVAGPLLTSSSG